MKHLGQLFILFLLLSGCSREKSPASGTYSFPQGVASGDPQPGAITLWTRAIRAGTDTSSIELQVQISKTENFATLLHEGVAQAKANRDHTIRYHASGLPNAQKLFYRFIAGRDTSDTGRTFTAPADDISASLNFATLACSSYEQGFYGTLKRMIIEDKNQPADHQIQVVFHLGDFIYEVVGDDPRNDNHHPQWLVAANGQERLIPPFPQGRQRPNNGHWKSGSWNPITVDDYRHLYKTYLSNPVLQEARARWPFIYTWDDHEFTDGNHQSLCPEHEVLGLPGTQQIKVAANQAWFEYQPAALDHGSAIGEVSNPAHDFRSVQVENAPVGSARKDGLYDEENNLKAIGSLCMYRALPWGKDILILVPDTKSYQNPGKSVLGRKQKKWFKDLLKRSAATWKLWANSEPILAAEIDFASIPAIGKPNALLYNDSWKQAAAEREEILGFLAEEAITGVVSLSGDYHIQIASTVATREGTPVLADFAVTSMSAFADFFWLERKGRGFDIPAAYQLFAYPDSKGQLLPNINTTIQYGAAAGREMALTNDFERAIKKADPAVNPGIRYFDCAHNGYLWGQVLSDQLLCRYVNTENARKDFEEAGAPVISTVEFTLDQWEVGDGPTLSLPEIKGEVFPTTNASYHE